MKCFVRVFLCITLFFGISNTFSAQFSGGYQSGQSTPAAVGAGEVTSGGFAGDVSLFTGTYNSSYTLGFVSTYSGLSYTATMTHSSVYTSGDNLSYASGIPYGEGWNLDLPTISVRVEDFNKYTLQKKFTYQTDPAGCTGPTDDCERYYDAATNSCNDAYREGALHWMQPMLAIPGVASGRMSGWGAKVLREYINNGDPEKYQSTHHERDQATDLDYRGARFYDSDLARVLSLDPLAIEYPAWSDYNYVLSNPVIFIDPDGRSVEATYKVDDEGNISKVDDKKYYDSDGNEVDKLVSGRKVKRDKNGNIKNPNIDVKKGVLKQGLRKVEYGRGKYEATVLRFGEDKSEAKKVFEFLANTTNVEWANLAFISGRVGPEDIVNSVVSSSHEE